MRVTFGFPLLLAMAELIAFFIANGILGFGPRRGAAISGWLSLWAGSELIAWAGKIEDKLISFELTTFTTVMAILVILLVVVSKDDAPARRSASRQLYGIFLGLGLILNFLMPLVISLLEI